MRLGRRHIMGGALAALLGSMADAPVAHAGARVRIGALRGPQAETLAYAAGLMEPGAPRVEIQPSPDADALLHAVTNGQLDACASHTPQQLAVFAGGTTLTAAFSTVTLPIGIYARHIHAIGQLRDADTIFLPDDALSFNRARVLLYNMGLLFAHEDGGLTPDFTTIVNPRKFSLVRAAATRLADHLSDASAVVMPYDEAVRAGLTPAHDAIALEDGKSPYAQVVAVRSVDQHKPWLASLARSVQSRAVRRFIFQRYGDSVETPW